MITGERESFAVRVPQAAIDDLARRLDRTRWTDAVEGTGWERGTSVDYLRGLVEHWRTRFDWLAQERRINRWPHFRVPIDGLRIHFLHVPGKGPAPLPLVLTHGWPGSFLEFEDLIPLLTEPDAHGADPRDAFEVIVPSIPGYGFSDRPRQPGMSNAQVAELWIALLEHLGHRRFGLQGGDWGAGISTWVARREPSRVVGLHLNYIPGSYRPGLAPTSAPLSLAEEGFLESKRRWGEEEGAYGHLQATRPQTLGIALNDSPAGLAAWIVEKLRGWSDCAGDVERRFGKDQILTHVALYWFTETIHSSMRLYLESARTPLQLGAGERIKPPTAVAVFPREAPSPPREWVERGYNLQRWTEMPSGGHFAAMEEPHRLAEDLRAFFRPLRDKVGR